MGSIGSHDTRAFTWPNKAILLDDGSVEVFCSSGRSFFVDLESYKKISHVRWSMDERGRVDRKLPRTNKRIKLHRFLTNCPDDKFIDHINGNPNDNRMCNLRAATSSQNLMNRVKNKAKKYSSYKGVFPYNNSGTFYAKLRTGNATHILKGFKTQEDAAIAYNELSLKHFGEYAKMNEVNYGPAAT